MQFGILEYHLCCFADRVGSANFAVQPTHWSVSGMSLDMQTIVVLLVTDAASIPHRANHRSVPVVSHNAAYVHNVEL